MGLNEMKKFRFITLGCKVNQYETQAMKESLLREGLEESQENQAEVIVLNTCTVTEDADHRNRYWLRRLRRENPNAKIVVTGCWVEKNRKEIAGLPEVDLILSNQEKPDLAERLFQGCATPEVQKTSAAPFRSKAEFSPLQISTFQGHGRAFIKIQDGCNHACSFCKVVLVRGRSRSRDLPEIVQEAKRLQTSGYREIVLTGIQLGAYGFDLELKQNLISLLENLNSVSGIERIRLSSIEPTDVKPDLIDAMKRLGKVCPQVHTPLQSGDATVLKKMNRRYSQNFYSDLIKTLRNQIPDFCLSMDVMAGFPGEEEEHFENTLTLIEETRPIRIHAFPYSRRAETQAAKLPDLPREILRKRMQRLIQFSKEVSQREKEKFLGRDFPVLVENPSSDGPLQGHTAHYLKVAFHGPKEWVGKMVRIRLQEIKNDCLFGVAQEVLHG